MNVEGLTRVNYNIKKNILLYQKNQMVQPHIILVIFWAAFSVLHSLLAAAWFKKRIEALIKSGYKFYRISYSFLAVFTLAFVLWYHFSIKSTTLWNAPP